MKKNGGIGVRHYFCLLGKLTESQFSRLKHWIRKFRKEDPFFKQITTEPITEWDENLISLNNYTEVALRIMRFDTIDDSALKEKIKSNHNDFEIALRKDTEALLNDVFNPYRILYEVCLKADFFRPSGQQLPERNRSASSRSASKTTAHKTKSDKKGGHPRSKRTAWIMRQHNKGLSYLKICEKWNGLSPETRKNLDPSDQTTYDLSDSKAKIRAKDRVRKLIERNQLE